MTSIPLDFVGLFITISGFIIGLGAVTVIDIHGFLGRTSPYWTEATTRTHKVTKPMIWVGIALVIIGGLILYRNSLFTGIPMWHAFIALGLVINGCFLSLKVSPFMLQREKEGRQAELVPLSWQRKIVASLIVSDILWWGGLVLLVAFVVGI